MLTRGNILSDFCFVTTCKRRLGQGNMFTGMCLFTGGGEYLTRYTPREQTPPRTRPPLEQTPPGSRHPPGADIPHKPPPRADTPQSRPPRTDTPLGADTPHLQSRHHPPPVADTPSPPSIHPPGRYSQCAGGTHPTGMQSCFDIEKPLMPILCPCEKPELPNLPDVEIQNFCIRDKM